MRLHASRGCRGRDRRREPRQRPTRHPIDTLAPAASSPCTPDLAPCTLEPATACAASHFERSTRPLTPPNLAPSRTPRANSRLQRAASRPPSRARASSATSRATLALSGAAGPLIAPIDRPALGRRDAPRPHPAAARIHGRSRRRPDRTSITTRSSSSERGPARRSRRGDGRRRLGARGGPRASSSAWAGALEALLHPREPAAREVAHAGVVLVGLGRAGLLEHALIRGARLVAQAVALGDAAGHEVVVELGPRPRGRPRRAAWPSRPRACRARPARWPGCGARRRW
jgi:hypothetical protein